MSALTRAAQAVADVMPQAPSIHHASPGEWDAFYFTVARVVIETMREPGEPILDAVRDARWPSTDLGESGETAAVVASLVDAILAGK